MAYIFVLLLWSTAKKKFVIVVIAVDVDVIVEANTENHHNLWNSGLPLEMTTCQFIKIY